MLTLSARFRHVQIREAAEHGAENESRIGYTVPIDTPEDGWSLAFSRERIQCPRSIHLSYVRK